MNKTTLLIVGNGFDLNFGLKTSYRNFLDSNEFHIIEDNNLSKYIKAKEYLQNWVDVEVELSNYCQDFYRPGSVIGMEIGSMDPHSVIRQDYQALKENLKSYLRRINRTDLKISKNDYAVELLKDLCRHQNETLDAITFNYTDTLERLAHPANMVSSLLDLRVCHVHGSLNEDDDIVFGVDDNSDLQREEVYLYKSYSKAKQIKPLFSLLDSYDNIVFFGYSLGDTDSQYFQPFFSGLVKDQPTGKNITFYYYGNSGYDDLNYRLQMLTNHRLSVLDSFNNIEFIDSKEGTYQRPRFLL